MFNHVDPKDLLGFRINWQKNSLSNPKVNKELCSQIGSDLSLFTKSFRQLITSTELLGNKMNQGKKIPSHFWNREFLEALKNSLGSITYAAKESGVTPQSYYAYRLKNPIFAKKADDILETICLPILEDIARSRAMKTSDKLLMFLLRNLSGGKWNRDKIEDARARDEPRMRRDQRYRSIEAEQRVPTEIERAAAKAYREVLIKHKMEK